MVATQQVWKKNEMRLSKEWLSMVLLAENGGCILCQKLL
jgi:hypothetical protein